MSLMPIQRRILGHCITFNENGKLPYETILYSTIKKSGKTAIAASVGAWYAEEARPGTEIYVIANTLEQGAGRVMRDLQFHFQKRIEQGVYSKKKADDNHCNISEYRIELANGTFIQVLASSFKSVAGSRHSLTLWDELWGNVNEFDRRVWDEMVPIPTVTNSLRFISTYAGFENESELLWELFLRGIGPGEGSEHEAKGMGSKIEGMDDLPCWKNGKLFTYWSHEPTMPWQTDEFMDEAQQSERPAAFLRLFMNHWVTSHEEFIPIEWWDHAAKAYPSSAELWADHPFRHWPVTIAVDAGIKRDSTAIVVVGYDQGKGKVGLVTHRIWTPSPGDPVDIEATVETALLDMYNRYNVSAIVYDPQHLLATMQRLQRKGLPTRAFEQTIGNMTAASQLLYEVLKNRNLETYPDDTMRRHIQMSVAETTSRGFRIVKTKITGRHHIDGAVALAMACYAAITNGGVDISIPVRVESPFADTSELIDESQLEIPFPLRTE